jgi:hypothetical protein
MSTEMKGWKFLTGDVNWEDYGGMWCRQVEGVWWILRFENKEEWGDGAKGYYCAVLRLDVNEVEYDTVDSALSYIGLSRAEWQEEENEDTRAMMLVEALVSSGVSTPMWSAEGSRAMSVRKQAREMAVALAADDIRTEQILDEPFNKIGTTNRDVGKGDTLAGLRRTAQRVIVEGMKPEDQASSIMLKMYAAAEGKTLGGKVETELAAAGEMLKTGKLDG